MKFTDTVLCKMKMVCEQCRNNSYFIAQQEERYGKWDCPDGLPVNASSEEVQRIPTEVSYQQMLDMDGPVLNPLMCAYGGDSTGIIKEPGCCGQMNTVQLFPCSKHKATTLKKCKYCSDFKDKEEDED